jgi:predicted 2-oxoglutarate/Fe(II)-dependent dioxygenase YbiX
MMRAAEAGSGEIRVRGRSRKVARKRLVDVVNVPPRTRDRVERALIRLVPRLSAHFGRRLSGLEPVQFLRYETGGRYGLHTDRAPGSRDPHVRRRRVSVIVLLSRPGPGRLIGGELAFPGIDSRGSRTRFSLAVRSEPGLLIAFRPEIEHEVLQVRKGTRYSLATWFTG